MDNVRAGRDYEEILGSLHESLKKAETAMVSMLEGIVADNDHFLTELEAALTDMEAALAND